MPKCSGLELLKRVRADARYKKLPFVLLTAEAEASQVKEALMSGVSNYIVKPFTADVIKMKLEQAYKKVAA
jgi:two-component system chemotaxis response regulator CheY